MSLSQKKLIDGQRNPMLKRFAPASIPSETKRADVQFAKIEKIATKHFRALKTSPESHVNIQEPGETVSPMQIPLIRRAELEDAPEIAKIHVDSWRSTYAGIIAPSYLAALSQKQREILWRKVLSDTANFSIIHVAESLQKGMLGFVSAGPQRCPEDAALGYPGELYALYLRQAHQRQGIGRMLFEVTENELRKRNLTPFLLWVLAANPARRFYEALGGLPIREKVVQIGQQHLNEVAYAWGKPS